MADTKISNLTALTTPNFEDLLAVVDDPSGTPTTKKITVANLSAIPVDTASDGATVTFDLSSSNRQQVTLGGNRTLALSNDAVGQVFIIKIIQDATGSRTVTWWSNILWPGGTAPTLSTAANSIDTFVFIKSGASEYLGYTLGLDMQSA